MKAALALLAAAAAAVVPGAIATIPTGFAAWFETDCPQGWDVLPNSEGRMVVSVSSYNNSGTVVGKPLADQEDRSHTHPFTATINLPVDDIAGADGPNDQGSMHGLMRNQGSSYNSTSGLAFVQLNLCVMHSDPGDWQIPFGTVAFFDPDTEQCPSGFVEFDDVEGRTILPGYDMEVTKSAAQPLRPGEVRTHAHSDTGGCQAQVAECSYVGIDGCCNDNPAPAGTYDVKLTYGEAESGLPYMTLLTCGSANQSFNATLPAGALLFSGDGFGCPTGWELADEAAGRYVISTPNGGVNNAMYGDQLVTKDSQQLPTHWHPVAGIMETRSVGIALADGCCGGGYAQAGRWPFACESGKEDIGMPYVMMPLCRQSE